jgi:hypothetical protein
LVILEQKPVQTDRFWFGSVILEQKPVQTDQLKLKIILFFGVIFVIYNGFGFGLALFFLVFLFGFGSV